MFPVLCDPGITGGELRRISLIMCSRLQLCCISNGVISATLPQQNTHTHTHMHTHRYTYIPIHTSSDVPTYPHRLNFIHTHTHTHTHKHKQKHTHTLSYLTVSLVSDTQQYD